MISTSARTYVDLDLDFGPNPVTKDVNKKVGDRAIITAVKNLILLNYFEKPFNPSIGSNVRRLLFEPMDAGTGAFLEKEITLTIKNYEPRVKLNNVYVDTDNENQGYNVTIEFFIVNRIEPVTVTFFLERLR